MYTITKEFAFSASHILIGLADEHPCGRFHGHNYVVKVELASPSLDKTSFVLDYGELKPIKDFIDDNLDHRHLNDIIIGQPSAENIASFLYNRFKPSFPLLNGIGVSETPKTWAWYRSHDISIVNVPITIDWKELENKIKSINESQHE